MDVAQGVCDGPAKNTVDDPLKLVVGDSEEQPTKKKHQQNIDTLLRKRLRKICRQLMVNGAQKASISRQKKKKKKQDNPAQKKRRKFTPSPRLTSATMVPAPPQPEIPRIRGSGVKRPLGTDNSSKLGLAKRQKTGGVKSNPSFASPAPSTLLEPGEENEWNGFSTDEGLDHPPDPDSLDAEEASSVCEEMSGDRGEIPEDSSDLKKPTFTDLFCDENYVIRQEIFKHIGVAGILNLRGVNRGLRELQYKVWDINTKLRRFFDDPIAFRSVLGHNDALISGSFVLQFLERVTWPASRMHIMVTEGEAASNLEAYLIKKEGYERESDHASDLYPVSSRF
jgi:hypothetical protein